MENVKVYNIYHVINNSDLQSFIKEVNAYTKIGWVLRGELNIDHKGNYCQVLTIKNNSITWSSSDSDSDE